MKPLKIVALTLSAIAGCAPLIKAVAAKIHPTSRALSGKWRNIMKHIFLAVFLAAMSSFSHSGDADWLIGNWQMTYDPDGDTKDIISFQKGGGFVTTEASSGNQIKGMYFLRPSHIDVSLIHQGAIFMKLKLEYDADKNKLFYNPDNTDDPAYYTRIH